MLKRVEHYGRPVARNFLRVGWGGGPGYKILEIR